ncbi:RNA-binding domain-containing protein [Phanerochaete sordida]|uniref:RNA-binding domain-containing protein n=1 Tax=Phanerochaete sordida TaxID=48140 RepID=A0A9P3LFS9_9APHY|nr:RNA-binding domain-containing protein [Phanerochaete sordida]
MPRILFVSGFHPTTRARDLAYEFERYGPLVRCDVPAPRNPHANSNPYAFVEFRSTRDAEDAYYEMHGRNFDGARLSIQWAKNPPSSVWRYDRRSPPRRDRDRSRSPRRNGRDRSDRDRDRDRERERERPRERDRDRDERDRDRDRDEKPRRSRSPERRRSPTPERRRDDRARTPPPLEEGKKEEDRAQTPPYDN